MQLEQNMKLMKQQTVCHLILANSVSDLESLADVLFRNQILLH